MGQSEYALIGVVVGGVVAALGTLMTTILSIRAAKLRLEHEGVLTHARELQSERRRLYVRFLTEVSQAWSQTLDDPEPAPDSHPGRFYPLFHLYTEVSLLASTEITATARELFDQVVEAGEAVDGPSEASIDDHHALRMQILGLMREDLLEVPPTPAYL